MDSAAGPLKEIRNKEIQAVLPFKGKPHNAWQIDLKTMNNDTELLDLVKVMGVPPFDPEKEYTEEYIAEQVAKSRFGKYIITADADIDGSHIKTLFMTFFLRAYRPFVEAGMLYAALPPLYKITKGRETFFLKNERELQRFSNAQLSKIDFKYFNSENEELDVFKKYIMKNISIIDVFKFIASKYALEPENLGWLYSAHGYFEINSVADLASAVYNTLEGFGFTMTGFHASTNDDNFVISFYDDQKSNKTIHINYSAWQAVSELNESLIKHKKMPESMLEFMMTTAVMELKGKQIIVNSYTLLKCLFDANPFTIIRQKGLGETNAEDLAVTTVDPVTRNIRQIMIEDVEDCWNITNDFMVKNSKGIKKRLNFVSEIIETSNFSVDV